MSSFEPETTPDMPSSPVATKQSDLNAFPVTPSPTKDSGSKHSFIDNDPPSNAFKTLCTTPPTKVTDDPFIDDRKPSATLLVRIKDTKTHDKTLIPVTMKMIHSAVSENNYFFLKDGRQLHLVKVVGALLHFHEFRDTFNMEIEDGTGRMRVVLPLPSCPECSGALQLRRKCTINSYVRVIGMVVDDFNMRTIIASDVRPVKSGNEITYHLLEVAYSFDKVMKKQLEEKFDAELLAVDLNQIVFDYQSAIKKKRKAEHAINFDDDEGDDLNAIDLNSFITGHMNDIANEKL
jgi:hypothetical protein